MSSMSSTTETCWGASALTVWLRSARAASSASVASLSLGSQVCASGSLGLRPSSTSNCLPISISRPTPNFWVCDGVVLPKKRRSVA